jgi:hypothetical protein
MKRFYIIFIFAIVRISLNAQTDIIDSLIQNINNNQLFGTCHYAWFLEMNSSAGNSLIKMGNQVVPRLIPFLDNRDKGIIIHYILANIFGNPCYFSSSFEHFEKDSILDYDYGGLKFYDKNGQIFTSNTVLINNKNKWIERIKSDKHILDYDKPPLKD